MDAKRRTYNFVSITHSSLAGSILVWSLFNCLSWLRLTLVSRLFSTHGKRKWATCEITEALDGELPQALVANFNRNISTQKNTIIVVCHSTCNVMNSINSGGIRTSAEGCACPFNEERVVKYIQGSCVLLLYRKVGPMVANLWPLVMRMLSRIRSLFTGKLLVEHGFTLPRWWVTKVIYPKGNQFAIYVMEPQNLFTLSSSKTRIAEYSDLCVRTIHNSQQTSSEMCRES